ncbi:hypothetical protein [Streptomyces telluris]|uniref:Uncharacterized protein n=1 Tax=Streptomyces telluris TaxID=2720021 RepID=A0A9X2LGV7_9ACTN|nr:hypothetical protein [Streptomyces telluris]MCQ8770724.1 hypothetical protein [Streptomyces telluris]NJP76955.1 hypothetical protein [Streptomyces telluris]
MARATAQMGKPLRGLLMAAGGLCFILGVALVFLWHSSLIDLTGAPRLVGLLVFRGAEAALIWGGAWVCVRGWNGGPEVRQG